MSTVIGIHDGHNASVALVRDGRIELALQEERMSRVKNQGDAPAGGLAYVNAFLGSHDWTKTPGEARLALNGLYMNYGQWEREVILKDYGASSALTGRAKQRLKGGMVDRWYQSRKAEDRERKIEELGFRRHQMDPVEHHQAHAAAAYYTCPWPDERVLVLTCDGSGDRVCATVNIGQAGQITRIAEVPEHDSIGRLYALVTRSLGMLPLEHEYKVMGLAPYGPSGGRVEQAARGFLEMFEFTRNPLVWRRRAGVPSLYAASAWLHRLLAGQRFDCVAAGIQYFIEQMLTAWVRAAVRETGISKVACAGGVFMNVKANLAILEIPEVEDLYIAPSCGDEANSIGAACQVAVRSGDRIQPLGPIYYGDPITDMEVEDAVRTCPRQRQFTARYSPSIEHLTARHLAAGKIVARAKGGMEFGARALGNRSILARPDSPHAVRVINEMVKQRDFWMPFAPSVLAERAEDYYDKPKPVSSPYMMLAFRSRPAKRSAFPAAQHPYDFTTRPHEVQRDHNPDYWRLLKEYEASTGEGILLNTSFNVHGEPIVYRATDALDVFLRSGLEYMALGNWWVEKSATE